MNLEGFTRKSRNELENNFYCQQKGSPRERKKIMTWNKYSMTSWAYYPTEDGPEGI